MKLTNRENLLLSSLEKEYKKRCINSLNHFDKVFLAIEIIERRHRNIIWRFFEYVYLGFMFLIYYINNSHIKNLSIGKYQLKVSFILDYLNIEYILDMKKINIREHKSLIFSLILKNRNNKEVLIKLIQNYYFISLGEIDYEKLKYFIQEYSRNLPFEDNFNYFYVLKKMINIR